MKLQPVKNNIVVVGLGLTGISVINYLKRTQDNAIIKVIDTRENPPEINQLPCDVKGHFGSWNEKWLLDASLIVVSPGISLASPLLKKAKEKGIEIIGDIELFAQAVTKPVIGITGSNGKSTVTCLLGEMAKMANINVGVGGNIGFAALDMLCFDHQLYILELSSFQLETTSSLAMPAAVFLNLSEDHMDRYDSMDAYCLAKLRIFESSSIAVFNYDQPQTKPFDAKHFVSFGLTGGDYTLAWQDGEQWLSAKGENIMPVADIALVGRHNVANCLAAMALADVAKISRQAQCMAMRQYHGLAHRCQKVAEHKGVMWVNDSKATNLASTLAALDGLTLKGKLHLLVGGDGKGADFSSLKKVLCDQNVILYCYGRDKHLFSTLVELPVVVDTLHQAMDSAFAMAKEGDMILLSPACASTDQFANFMARGDSFISYANKLIKKEILQRELK